MRTKTAIILGATGLTGSHLLDMLLDDDAYEKVKVFTRTSTGKQHPKLEEILCDVLKLQQYEDRFIADEIFCCIGTTKAKTPDKKLYHAIDFGIPVVASILAEKNNVTTFSVISAIGAHKNSRIFYSRTKGEMEEAVLQSNIPNILIYRPSLIFGKRKEKRWVEGISLVFMKILQVFFIGKLKNYKPIHAKDLAKVIYWEAQHTTTGHHIIFKEQFEPSISL